jgi:hypothetical protein
MVLSLHNDWMMNFWSIWYLDVRVLYENGLRSLSDVMHNNRLMGNDLFWSVNGEWFCRCFMLRNDCLRMINHGNWV